MLRKFILGTANFGMTYGITGQGNKLSKGNIADILSTARILNVAQIDTAPAYGNAEQIIGEIGVGAFKLTTKLHGLATDDWPSIISKIEQSSTDLKINMPFDTILAHDPLEISGQDYLIVYNNLSKLKEYGYTKKIGLSIYNADQMKLIRNVFLPDVVQVPVNLLDQRVFESDEFLRLKDLGCEIHARSIFLQGLLAMHEFKIPQSWSSKDVSDLQNVYKYCKQKKISARKLALNWILSKKIIDKIVVGVECSAQLMEIMNDIDENLDLAEASKFRSGNIDLIEPYRW